MNLVLRNLACRSVTEPGIKLKNQVSHYNSPPNPEQLRLLPRRPLQQSEKQHQFSLLRCLE